MGTMDKTQQHISNRLAILGGGNIGTAIAKGIVESGRFSPDQITITRRNENLLQPLASGGYVTHSDNRDAVRGAATIIIAVQPQQLVSLLQEIGGELDPDNHLIISVVTGVTIAEIRKHIEKNIPIVRAMPNTAIAIRESMTCLASQGEQQDALEKAELIFGAVGKTLIISESHMIPATAVAACGVAFFLRSIRAASQGGIEIGFHTDEALVLAAQTARGAASLLLHSETHPESEIDKVTTPRGCTIAGLNEMEHQGFSSAMIKGILTSAEMAAKLFVADNPSVE